MISPNKAPPVAVTTEPSSLCQRRSKSLPPELFQTDEIGSLVENGYPSNPKGYSRREKNTPSPGALELARSIAVGAAMLLIFVLLLTLSYWLAFFSGLYNPDSDCPVQTFDYPDCSNSLMHVGEVAPPLTSEEWLGWRERYHQAMVDAGKGSEMTLAEDWREPNTYGFTDMSSLEFRNSPGKGRAVFAAKLIPKGTKIWDSRYRAVIPDSCVAKVFFASHTRQQKCDSIFWGYLNNFYGNGIQYMIDLDGHGYINHRQTNPNTVHHFEGELEKDRYVLPRLPLPSWRIFPLSKKQWERRNRPGSYGLYAAHDIQAGEEIFYDYEEIYMRGFVDWFTIFLERSLPVREWETL